MLYCNHDRPIVPDRRRDRPDMPRGGGACGGLGSGDLGPMITLDNVELRHGERVVLSGVSGTIETGSLTALVGRQGQDRRSGSG